jgi:hypothetical protein
MAKVKIERMLNLGAAYTPEMGAGGKPEPTWATLREQGARRKRSATTRSSRSKCNTTRT